MRRFFVEMLVLFDDKQLKKKHFQDNKQNVKHAHKKVHLIITR